MINILAGLILLLITLLAELVTRVQYDESTHDASLSSRLVYSGGATQKNKNPTDLIPIANPLSPKIIDVLKYINHAVSNPKPVLLYDDLPYSYKYGSYGIFRHNCHYGQRKLLLNEIQFFTQYLKSSDDLGSKVDCVVYVGSAPCEHLTIIMELFPNSKFLLIDPNFCIIDTDKSTCVYQNPDVISEHAMAIVDIYRSGAPHQANGVKYLEQMEFLDGPVLNMVDFENNKEELYKLKRAFERSKINLFDRITKSDKSVFIIQDYMTIELSKIIANSNKNILFLSDLRTLLFGVNKGVSDADILYNDCLQIAMLHILKPTYSMLKFHPPYYDPKDAELIKSIPTQFPQAYAAIEYVNKLMKKDLIKEAINHKHHNYVSDHIYLQPWGPTSSTEARLIVSRNTILSNKYKWYDSIEWENKYYVLRYIRMYSAIDVFATILPRLKSYGYDFCYDCYIELSILYQYLKNVTDPAHIPSASDQLSKFEELLKLITQVNSHLKYGLSNVDFIHSTIKKYTNKACVSHGCLVPHKHNYFYVNLLDDRGNRTQSQVVWHNDQTYQFKQIGLHEFYNQELLQPLQKKNIEFTTSVR